MRQILLGREAPMCAEGKHVACGDASAVCLRPPKADSSRLVAPSHAEGVAIAGSHAENQAASSWARNRCLVDQVPRRSRSIPSTERSLGRPYGSARTTSTNSKSEHPAPTTLVRHRHKPYPPLTAGPHSPTSPASQAMRPAGSASRRQDKHERTHHRDGHSRSAGTDPRHLMSPHSGRASLRSPRPYLASRRRNVF